MTPPPPATTVPASTTETARPGESAPPGRASAGPSCRGIHRTRSLLSTFLIRTTAVLALLGPLWGCNLPISGRRPARPAGPSPTSRQDPSLSGNGRYLASIQPQGAVDGVLLQEQPSGRPLRLRRLSRLRPHRSPSLSWNGRYLAVVGQQGFRRLVLIEDRASGRLHRIPFPGPQEPQRLALSPDGRRLAVEVLDRGRPRLRLFDLSGLLEADLPAGQRVLPEPAT